MTSLNPNLIKKYFRNQKPPNLKELENKNQKYFYKWDGEGLRYEIQEFISCVVNKRFSTARLRRRESVCMAEIMQAFSDRKNFFEI